MAVKYMSPEQMSQQTGVSLPVMHKVFEAAEAKRYPRLFIKTKGQHRGRLVVQGDATYDAVISAANKVAKSLGQSPAQAGTAPLVVPIGEFVVTAEDMSYETTHFLWSPAGTSMAPCISSPYASSGRRLMRFARAQAMSSLTTPTAPPASASTDQHIRFWYCLFELWRRVRPRADSMASMQASANSPDSGNIDHVIPRSAGGSPCLCNLQVMRVRSNTEKSSDVLPDVSGEPQESLRVLEALQRGARGAAAEGRISDATLDAFDRILCTEISECLSMLKTREVAAVIARKGARRAGRCLGNAIRDAAGAVVRAPRRLAIRYATRLISEP